MENTENMTLPNGKNPEEILKENYVNKAHQVMLGMVIENHTPYDLVNPGKSINSCPATEEIKGMEVKNISRRSSEMILFDNGHWQDYGLCGSIHWQIRKNGFFADDAQRLVVTFRVPYSGACHRNRGNSFSLFMEKIRLNQDKQWKYPSKADYDYDDLHGEGKRSVYQAKEGQRLLVSLENGDFFVTAEINNACDAFLKMKIFHTLTYHKNLLKTPKSQKHVMVTTIAPVIVGQDGKTQSMTMTILKWLGIGFGIFIVLLLLIIGLSISAKKRQQTRINRLRY